MMVENIRNSHETFSCGILSAEERPTTEKPINYGSKSRIMALQFLKKHSTVGCNNIVEKGDQQTNPAVTNHREYVDIAVQTTSDLSINREVCHVEVQCGCSFLGPRPEDSYFESCCESTERDYQYIEEGSMDHSVNDVSSCLDDDEVLSDDNLSNITFNSTTGTVYYPIDSSLDASFVCYNEECFMDESDHEILSLSSEQLECLYEIYFCLSRYTDIEKEIVKMNMISTSLHCIVGTLV